MKLKTTESQREEVLEGLEPTKAIFPVTNAEKFVVDLIHDLELALGEIERYRMQWIDADNACTDFCARNGHLESALSKIANGEGCYGAQAREYKEIARQALAERSE